MKKILLSILLLTSLVACGSNTSLEDIEYPSISYSSSYEISNEVANMAEYPDMTAIDHPFLKLTAVEVKELIDNDGSAIVYFGYPHCPYCQQAVPVLSEVATNMDLNIYYVDVYQDDEKISATDQMTALTDLIENEFSPLLSKDESGYPTFYTPDVFVIKDGNIIANHEGLVDGDGSELSNSEKVELAQTYIDLFSKIQ